MRVGLLLPNSNFIPLLATDIRQGISDALGRPDQSEPELVVETTTYNESATQVRAKVQDLLIKHDVDVVVAPLNAGMIVEVEALLSAHQTPLIVLTMGEDVFAGDAAPPWVFVNSMQLWRSTWLTGWWTAGNVGTRACTIATALEGGYGMNFAFAVGLEAGGGTLLATIPAPVDFDEEAATTAIAAALEFDPDVLMIAAAGERHELLIRAAQQIECRIPFVALPPYEYDATPRPAVVERHRQPWFSTWDAGSGAGRSFVDEFVAAAGRPAHAYAVLAHEAGELLARAAQTAAVPRGDALRVALSEVGYDGPRGHVSFTGTEQEVVGAQQLLHWEVGDGDARVVGEPFDTPATLAEHVALARTNMGKQGWLNPYLIA